jgi:hypothetical protein
MVLLLVERDVGSLAGLAKYFQRVVLASDIAMEGVDSLLFRYTAFEACMAMKAQLLLWAMEEFTTDEHFLYLDSDIFAYSRFEELEFALPRASILLTPHHVYDEYSYEATCDNMLRTLLCGVFNTGFVAVRRSPMAAAFLTWWTHKLFHLCYKDSNCGLYYEQKWLDAAIAFFDLTILREPSYNVANWNIQSRNLTNVGHDYRVNGRPLRFVHFSMLDSGRDLYYFHRHVPASNPIFAMRQTYVSDLDSFDVVARSRMQWSYDFYRSGERIDPEARRAWQRFPQLRRRFADPFAQSNVGMRVISQGKVDFRK